MRKKRICLLFSLILCLNQPLEALAYAYTMSYMFGGTSATYLAYLERPKDRLTAVSPDYFEINPDGSLYLPPKIDQDLIDTIHKRGMEVIPFLSNNWDKDLGIAALNNTDLMTDQIAQAVKTYGFDGVNVDIQNVNQDYKDAYTKFVRLLKEKLPDKSISVAVAANPNAWTLGWHGSYDYAALAQHCDYLMIMAYDESYYGGPAGPVASIEFVEKSIQYALQHTTPDKIVLGVNFFGRYWKQGSSVGGSGIVNKDVETLIKNYESKKDYVKEYESCKVTVTIKENDFPPKLWSGSVLGPGTYEIWYDDIQTLNTKIQLVDQYNLKGLGSWAMGQEDPLIWDYYFPEEPGYPRDITPHWASEYMKNVIDRGWMGGIAPGTFAPEKTLTRAEAATLVMNVTGYGVIPETLWKNYDFNDSKNHWARGYIASARYYGIMNGRDAGTFDPDAPISRQEMALIMDKIFFLPDAIDHNESPFYDVSQTLTPWAFYSIIKLYQNKILSGYNDGSFKPRQSITRAETAVMLDKLAEYGIKETPYLHRAVPIDPH